MFSRSNMDNSLADLTSERVYENIWYVTFWGSFGQKYVQWDYFMTDVTSGVNEYAENV
jgi:hypothetical protein